MLILMLILMLMLMLVIVNRVDVGEQRLLETTGKAR